MISLVIGSYNDYEAIIPAIKELKKFNLKFELVVSSAHRNTEETIEWAKKAESRGTEVIIAFAGLAAHLPGVLAAVTTLPVVGVPLTNSPVSGMDSMFSIVQMPSGVPVATVGLGNVKNAIYLAMRILSIKYPDIKSKLLKASEDMKKNIREQNKVLQEKLKDL
ncbi:MAG: 5-(carboxyamino)imidazole ribonucleotide mutase [Thermodesulfobium narugense]|nr:MAG: 5-(carboxyamino)imidazole ribonucleotide mutase [Thermodesulfobium narugense]